MLEPVASQNFVNNARTICDVSVYGEKWRKFSRVPVVIIEKNNGTPKKINLEVLGYGTPKKGQYFYSGAIPRWYTAPNDLTGSQYLIASCKP